MAKCPNCGKEVGEGMAFCPSCGSKLTVDKDVLKIKIDELRHNEKLAWSVAILGIFGAVVLLVLGSWIGLSGWALDSVFTIMVLLVVVGVMSGVYAGYLSYKRSKLIEQI